MENLIKDLGIFVSIYKSLSFEIILILPPLALQPFVGFGFLKQVIPSFPIHC
jgi:hypothetical protein